MPEGDTLHKIAAYMRPRLTGALLLEVRVASRPLPELARRRVTAVETHGKHLLLRCGSTYVLRVHLGMHGSWHAYPTGARWRRPAFRASVVLRVADAAYVCFDAADVACSRLPSTAAAASPDANVSAHYTPLAHLGPDIFAADWDAAAIARRARRLPPSTPLVDVLLDQRVTAGIGNVFKCEALFLERLAPLRATGALGDATLTALFARAHALMHANLGGWRRTTTVDRRREPRPAAHARLWVYGRKGAPCRACGAAIARADLGRTRRSTYWCEQCQAEACLGL